MNKNQIRSTLLLVSTLFLVGASITVLAATDSSSVNATYTTGGSGLGHVSGRDTGALHYLASGHSAVLNITRTNASAGVVAAL